MLSPRGGYLISRQQKSLGGKEDKQPPQPQRIVSSHTRPKQQPANASLAATVRRDDDRHSAAVDVPRTYSTSSITTDTSISPRDTSAADLIMAKRKQNQDADSASPSPTPSPPTTTTFITRPTTPTSPVRIPPSKQQKHEKRYHSGPNKRRESHNSDAVPPSVAALLAITNIPRSRARRSLGLTIGGGKGTAIASVAVTPVSKPRSRNIEGRMTVDSIVQRSQEAEKTISLKLSRHPLAVLLSSPAEEDCDGDIDNDGDTCFSDDCSFADDASFTCSTLGTNLSARTISNESVPSLADSYSFTLSSSSPRTPISPSVGRRRSSLGPRRRRPEPVSSPPGSDFGVEDHPLSSLEELDFRVFGDSPDSTDAAETGLKQLDDDAGVQRFNLGLPLQPLKSAFKSNLTASLRALRSAARSFSTLNLSSIPPEDFLTRSILTIDPRVPFTDERRPPPLDEEPSAALRRYLNPTTSAPLDPHPQQHQSVPGASRGGPGFTASIQMQTYKVHRLRSSPSSASSLPLPSTQLGRRQQQKQQQKAPVTDTNATEATQEPPSTDDESSSGAGGLPGRQREMRENSDFIRIAVMEMAMRKRGKLDDQRPGRARWALPPRRTATRPYEVGADGVPLRWVAIAAA